MEKIDKNVLKTMLGEVVKVMEQEKDYLIELDAAMGDGDLGLTMMNGFRSVRDELENLTIDDMGAIFMKLGIKMNATVPSTMGTLISTCFTKSAPEAKGKAALTLIDAVNMGRAAVNGVIERGRTKVGNKTMLDALHPAVEALAAAAEQGKTLQEAYAAAYQAAQAGVEKTKEMQSVHGRAAYYKEKSLGRPDSGAVAVMFIFKGISQSFTQ